MPTRFAQKSDWAIPFLYLFETRNTLNLRNIFRLSWGTSQELMVKNCLEIEWEDKEDEDDEKQKKLKAGSKRGESAGIQVEKKKGRKAAFFRENKIARTNFQDFLTAF